MGGGYCLGTMIDTKNLSMSFSCTTGLLYSFSGAAGALVEEIKRILFALVKIHCRYAERASVGVYYESTHIRGGGSRICH